MASKAPNKKLDITGASGQVKPNKERIKQTQKVVFDIQKPYSDKEAVDRPQFAKAKTINKVETKKLISKNLNFGQHKELENPSLPQQNSHEKANRVFGQTSSNPIIKPEKAKNPKSGDDHLISRFRKENTSLFELLPLKRKSKAQSSSSEDSNSEDLENIQINIQSDEESEADEQLNSTDIKGLVIPLQSMGFDDQQEKNEYDDAKEMINSDTSGENDEYIAGDSLEESELEDEEKQEEENERYCLGANGYPRKIFPEIDAVYDSDSSTDIPPNTVGNIPMKWYDDYPHIGYDIDGKKIMKPAKGDELDKFLDKMEDPNMWISVKDNLTQQDVKLTDEELDIIRRIQMQEIPDANYDPYEPMVEWFTSRPEIMPLSGAPEPKHRFIPSKWEAKRIMKLVRAIREGRIISGKTRVEKPRFYNLWTDSDQPREDHPTHIPAPKVKLPDHDESYNPPAEYLPTDKEKEEWEQMDPEDKEKNYLPQKFSSLRAVPAYGKFLQERFERALDLYLAPRVRRNKLNIDPDSLIPKLPSPKDLQPFPTSLSFSYNGHKGRIRSFSIDPIGLWLVSGSDDQTIRMWEITTGRCVKSWNVGDTVHSIAWCPKKDVFGFAVSFGNKVAFISPPDMCDDEMSQFTSQYVLLGTPVDQQDEKSKSKVVKWHQPNEAEQGEGYLLIITHSHQKTVKQVTWHRKGDYFASLAPDAGNQGILIHQLTKSQTQQPFRKIKGLIQRIMFHPIKPLFFVATQRHVRIYNLMKQEATKTLQSGVKWISSLDIHPLGDNVIIGSYDKRLCWFDLDLSMKPYKTLRYHGMAVRSVAFHKILPLFASCSDDGTIQIFHGMVYNDLLQNPLIVPVRILKGGHKVVESLGKESFLFIIIRHLSLRENSSTDILYRGILGVLHCEFHPIQPWIFSSGADHTINLWT
ncbi:hypothetical protein G9A89_018058 [Geosiphon pyriformis]|nr:hypothetical protein G9A89_018058 [Geosiphon pyriformis]